MSFKLFKSLLLKSSLIQKEIDREQKRTWPDRFRLIKLKKIRLSIKDKLQTIIQHSLPVHLLQMQRQNIQLRKTLSKNM